MRWKTFDIFRRRFVPFFLMPTPSENPLAGLGFPGCLRDHCDDLVPVSRVHQVQIHPGLPDRREMPVPFDKAGEGELSRQVDHLC